MAIKISKKKGQVVFSPGEKLGKYMKEISTEGYTIASCQGRPVLPADRKRIHKVTLALTTAEYEYFKKKAGHQTVSEAKPTARPKRKHGSMAGFIRLMMQTNRPLLTVEQERLLIQLVNTGNNLKRLTHMATSVGYDSVAASLEPIYKQLVNLLEDYSQQKRNKLGK